MQRDYPEIRSNRFLRGPTTISLTLALHRGTDDSVLGQFVLVEGYVASILLRKNWQLKTRFLDWMMELLILTDLNSTNKNVIISSRRFNSLQYEIRDTVVKTYL